MIVCGKFISYEYNSENLDKTVDLRKFHKNEHISMTQRSYVHNLGFIMYIISLAIPLDGTCCLASEILLFEAQCVKLMIIRQQNFEINLKKI